MRDGRPTAVVVGGGPGGLMAAEVLAAGGASVTLVEQMPSVGRKLLVAGRGGLNLSHTEPLDELLDRFGPARPHLESAVRAFDTDDLRAWCASLGEATIVGSSGRVFPESMRATPLLRAWLARLDRLGVTVLVRHRWTGWAGQGTVPADPPARTGSVASTTTRSGASSGSVPAGGHGGGVQVVAADGTAEVLPADVVVLALGGASWPRTGSDGAWVPVLGTAGVAVRPLVAANVGHEVGWSSVFAERFAGQPIKNVAVRVDGDAGRPARGELLVTTTGLEGGAIYALGPALRRRLAEPGEARLLVDLRPDVARSTVAERLARRPGDSFATALRRLGLPPVAVGLLREATDNRPPTDPSALADLVKGAPIRITASRPLDRAISTAGGVAFDELDESFMLRRRPGTWVVGEMVDWEAPTGGYLLHGTLAMAVAAARAALAWTAPPSAAR